jgi:hypothetical protein
MLQRVSSDGVVVVFQPGKGGLGVAQLKGSGFPNDLTQLGGLTTGKSASRFSILYRSIIGRL